MRRCDDANCTSVASIGAKCAFHARKAANQPAEAAPRAKKEPVKRPPPKKLRPAVKTALKGSDR